MTRTISAPGYYLPDDGHKYFYGQEDGDENASKFRDLFFHGGKFFVGQHFSIDENKRKQIKDEYIVTVHSSLRSILHDIRDNHVNFMAPCPYNATERYINYNFVCPIEMSALRYEVPIPEFRLVFKEKVELQTHCW